MEALKLPPHVSKERFESLLCIIKQTHMYEALESAGTVSRACYALLNTHMHETLEGAG